MIRLNDILHDSKKRFLFLTVLVNRQRLQIWSFYLFVFSIPISSYFSVRLLVLTLIFSLFVRGFQLNNLLRAWDVLLYLLVLMVGLFYSKDLLTGLRVIETNFSIIGIPLVFTHFKRSDEKLRSRIFYAFSFGLITASLICFCYGVFRYLNVADIKFLFFDYFTEPIKSHPTYFAYYLIFSISVELYFLYYHLENTYRLYRYLTILFLFFILILTGGQTAFISLLFIFSFFILKSFTEEVNSEKRVVTGLIVLMLSCMFLISIVEKGDRAFALNDSWERAVLWESAVSAMSNPLFGVGTGDYKIALNDYYITHNLTQFASESYNSHNQFIQILFSNGVLGILAFSFILGRPLYMAMKSRNILAILCMFPFLIYGMTEVFLGRYQGVVFFALLHQIFITDISSDISRAKMPLRESINVKYHVGII